MKSFFLIVITFLLGAGKQKEAVHNSQKETVKLETLNSLSDLYPNDFALGYQANEIRRVWSIQFDKQ